MSVHKLVIASHNPGKVGEIGELLAPLGFSVTSASELHLPEPEETGKTFAENAAIKSESVATATGITALADDSGLVVHALAGAPGVHSARWAGPDRDFRRAMMQIERELTELDTRDHSAKFVCTLALTRPGRATEIFEGSVAGTVVFPPRGKNGFGYDPIFVAEGMTQTFGEIDPERKRKISHRARAFAGLIAFLEQENTPA